MACQYCGELSTGPHPVARHLSYVCGYSHGYGPITPCTAVDKVQQCPYCKTRRLTPGTHIVPFSCGFQFGNGVRAESPCGHTVIAAISNPC
jgi:hypothetical protein